MGRARPFPVPSVTEEGVLLEDPRGWELGGGASFLPHPVLAFGKGCI